MNLINFFKINNSFGEKSSTSSLRYRRNRKFYNNKKEIYKSPFIKNYLPIINNFNSLNSTKNFINNKKSI